MCLSDSGLLIVLLKLTEWTTAGTNKELLFHVLLFPASFWRVYILDYKALVFQTSLLMNKKRWKLVYKVFGNFSRSLTVPALTIKWAHQMSLYCMLLFFSRQTWHI